MEKPLSVKKKEFEVGLVNLINESRLPAFIVETVLKDTYLQVKIEVEKEYKTELQAFEDQLVEKGGK